MLSVMTWSAPRCPPKTYWGTRPISKTACSASRQFLTTTRGNCNNDLRNDVLTAANDKTPEQPAHICKRGRLEKVQTCPTATATTTVVLSIVVAATTPISVVFA